MLLKNVKGLLMKYWNTIRTYINKIPFCVKITGILIVMAAFSLNYYYLPTARIVTGSNVDSPSENTDGTQNNTNNSGENSTDSAFDFSELIKCSRAGKRNLPIYYVATDSPKIAISFDAAWGNEDTRRILDILDKHDVKATFFMTGGWVGSYPDDVKEIAARGHELGNHSQNHKYMTKLSDSQKVEELMSVHKAVKELTGVDMQVFRPPYGDYNNDVVTTAFKCGYYTIQWNVDSLDWKDYGVSNIIKTVTNHKALQNGSIILMHNGAKYTADALDELISTLKAKGYEFVKMSDLIYKNDFHMDPDGRQVAN